MKQIYNQIIELAQKHNADKVILFGSRARGTHSDRSDIDIAVYGIPKNQQLQFNSAVDETVRTLLKFDIVHISDDTNMQLLDNIKKDGVILYERYNTKI